MGHSALGNHGRDRHPLGVEHLQDDGDSDQELSGSDPNGAIEAFWSDLLRCHRDLPKMLRTIASRVVDLIGDGCVLTLLSNDGSELRPEVIIHRDPVVSEAMAAVLDTGPSKLGEGIAGTVARDRRSILITETPQQEIAEAVPERYLPFLQEHPMRSLMIAPIVAAGQLFGTIGAIRTTAQAPYGPREFLLLETLAERAAWALADARAVATGVDAADFEAIYRHNLDPVLVVTVDGDILAANPAACVQLGRTEDEIVQCRRNDLVVTDQRLDAALSRRGAVGHFDTELTLRRGDGTTFETHVTSTVYTRPDGSARASVIFRDITEEVVRRAAAAQEVEQLRRAADHDPLTGLLNRRGLVASAQHLIAAADRHGLPVQLIFVDVDSLKAVNDSQGHAAGDAVLIAVAEAIEGSIREADIAGRIGGDEFLIVVADATPAEADRVSKRVREHLETRSDRVISVSCGVAERYPETDATLGQLIDAADRDLYRQRTLRRLRQVPRDPASSAGEDRR